MAQTQRRRNFSAAFKRKAVADARTLGIRIRLLKIIDSLARG